MVSIHKVIQLVLILTLINMNMNSYKLVSSCCLQRLEVYILAIMVYHIKLLEVLLYTVMLI